MPVETDKRIEQLDHVQGSEGHDHPYLDGRLDALMIVFELFIKYGHSTKFRKAVLETTDEMFALFEQSRAEGQSIINLQREAGRSQALIEMANKFGPKNQLKPWGRPRPWCPKT